MAQEIYTYIKAVSSNEISKEILDLMDSLAKSDEWSFGVKGRTEGVEFHDWTYDDTVSVIAKYGLPKEFIKSLYDKMVRLDSSIKLECKFEDENSDMYGVFYISDKGESDDMEFGGAPDRDDYEDEDQYESIKQSYLEELYDLQEEMLQNCIKEVENENN